MLDVLNVSRTVVAAIGNASTVLKDGYWNKDRNVNENVQRVGKKRSKSVSIKNKTSSQLLECSYNLATLIPSHLVLEYRKLGAKLET